MTQSDAGTQPWALDVSELTVNYDRTPVLWDLSLQIPQGVLCGIVGPNGAGKSTFLKTVLGLLTPVSGRVRVFGEPIAKQRQRIAYVPQRESVDWDFPITVAELVLMGRYGKIGLFRRPSTADKEAAMRCLNDVGMEAYADRQISQLSGGQQQRVFLARALMQDADLLFMDEPFVGVDHATEKVLVQLLKQLKEKGKTVLVVHHDLNTVGSYFDWTCLLNMRLIACGPTPAVFNHDNLNTAYGKQSVLLSDTFRLSQNTEAGLG